MQVGFRHITTAAVQLVPKTVTNKILKRTLIQMGPTAASGELWRRVPRGTEYRVVDHDVPRPRATGRTGSELHSDHDPGNSAASTPTAARAAAVTLAVTPEPQ